MVSSQCQGNQLTPADLGSVLTTVGAWLEGEPLPIPQAAPSVPEQNLTACLFLNQPGLLSEEVVKPMDASRWAWVGHRVHMGGLRAPAERGTLQPVGC